MYNSTKFEVWIKLPYSLALQLQTLITQKVFDLELRNFRSNILLYLRKAITQKLYVWAMS